MATAATSIRITNPHNPRHPMKWSNIKKYRRAIPESAYRSLRHYETVVNLSPKKEKTYRVCIVSEDRFYTIRTGDIFESHDDATYFSWIAKIEQVGLPPSFALFNDSHINSLVTKIVVHIRNHEHEDTLNKVIMYTWEENSKLLWHLQRAWRTHTTRIVLGIPVSITTGHKRSPADTDELYTDIAEEICSLRPHADMEEMRTAARLLHELSEAILHDREIKRLFFSKQRLLVWILNELPRCQAAHGMFERHSQLKLALALLSLICAALFNSETVDARLLLMQPSPFSISGMLEILTLDFDQGESFRAAARLRRIHSQHREHVSKLKEQKRREMRRRSPRKMTRASTTVKASRRSINIFSSTNSGTSMSTTGSMVKDTGNINTEYFAGIHRSKSSAHIWSHLEKRASTIGVPASFASSHVHPSPRHEHSMSRNFAIAQGDRRTEEDISGASDSSDSEYGREWSSAEEGDHDIVRYLSSSSSGGEEEEEEGDHDDERYLSDNEDDYRNENLNIEILSSLDRSNLDDAKIKVAKREADIYAKEHMRISEFDEINQINEVAHSPERSIHRAIQNSTHRKRHRRMERTSFSGSDSDEAEDDESNYDYMDAKLQESHDELIDRINEVQIFILLEMHSVISHATQYRLEAACESLPVICLNIPGFAKKRMARYIELMSHVVRKAQARHTWGTGNVASHVDRCIFSWRLNNIAQFLFAMSRSHVMRRQMLAHSEEEMRYYLGTAS
eukprot:g1804.t1